MTDLKAMGRAAAAVKPALQRMTAEEKNRGLLAGAEALLSHTADILQANRRDMEAAEKNGMNPGLLDRLRLNEERDMSLAEGLRQGAELPDCLGVVIEEFRRTYGLQVQKGRVPWGVAVLL